MKWERNHLTLLAADETGFKNLVKLSRPASSRGVARGKANVDLAADRYSEGGSCRPAASASRFCRRLVEDRPGDARAHVDDLTDLRRRTSTSTAGERDPRAGQGQRGDRAGRARARPAARRHRRRPLPAPRGLPQPCRPALRADEVDPRGAEAQLRDQRVLPEDRRGDARVVRALAGGDPEHARDRRSLQRRRSSPASQLLRFPTPDGSEPAYCCAASPPTVCATVTAPGARRQVERLEFELGVIEEMGFPSYFLIAWDFVRRR